VSTESVNRLTGALHEHMFDHVDRWHELENQRRALAMLPPEAPAMQREEAMRLLEELQAMDRRLRRLRAGMTSLLDQDSAGPVA
jgi:hypothetical protein